MATIKNLILLLALFLVSASSVFAGNYYDFTFINESGQSVAQVDFEAFKCLNDNCSIIDTSYYVSLDSLANDYLRYEAGQTAQPTNYALYLYTDGYLPKKYTVHDDWGYGNTTSVLTTFEKKDVCHAPLISYSVANEVNAFEPLQVNVSAQLDAEAASVFSFAKTNPQFRPASFYSTYFQLFAATTVVKVTIFDEDGNLVYDNEDVKDIFADETEWYTFDWIPQESGDHIIKVAAYIDDNQCANTIPVEDSKTTTVLENITDVDYYSVVNNLHYDPAFPEVDEQINLSVSYLSNQVFSNGDLVPAKTKLAYVARKGQSNPNGEVVFSFTLYSDASLDYDMFLQEVTDLSFGEEGWYTVYVTATPDDPLATGAGYTGNITSETVSAEMYIANAVADTFIYTITVKDSANNQPIEGVFGQLENGLTDISNPQGYVIFDELVADTYTYTLSKNGFVSFYSYVDIVNSDVSETVFMQKTECNDGLDNDGDGYFDLGDADCTDINDNTEDSFTPGNTACSDGVDNDGDGYVDMNDPSCSSPSDDDESPFDLGNTQCSDGLDNDGDGLVDLNDPSCSDSYDDDESPFDVITTPACSDGIDNDGDGFVDMNDPGCTHPNDDSEGPWNPGNTACSDGVDNDGDGYVDLADPSCSDAMDDDESPFDGPVVTQCNDGLDNDGDGYVDLNDPECSSLSDDSEGPWNPGNTACSDGLDNDGDGYVDLNDPECSSLSDDSEGPWNPGNTACSDGLDNDGDGYVDLNDPDCTDLMDDTEDSFTPGNTACSDGIDNDGDGYVDMHDLGCSSPSDDDETSFNHYTPEKDFDHAEVLVREFDFENIDFGTDYSLAQIFVMLENVGDDDVEDVTITLSIPELGVWDKARGFDLDTNDPKRLYFELDYLPEYAQGWYYVRLSITGSSYSKAKWYEVYLEE